MSRSFRRRFVFAMGWLLRGALVTLAIAVLLVLLMSSSPFAADLAVSQRTAALPARNSTLDDERTLSSAAKQREETSAPTPFAKGLPRSRRNAPPPSARSQAPISLLLPLNKADRGRACELLDSAVRFGYADDVVVFGWGSSKRAKMNGYAFRHMLANALDVVAARHGPDRLVLVMDAFDTLFAAPAAELLARYDSMGRPPFVVSGDQACIGNAVHCAFYDRFMHGIDRTPPTACVCGQQQQQQQPETPRGATAEPPWLSGAATHRRLYPNSGVLFGTAQGTAEAMARLMHDGGCGKGIDQGWVVVRAAQLGLLTRNAVVVDAWGLLSLNANLVTPDAERQRKFRRIDARLYDLYKRREVQNDEDEAGLARRPHRGEPRSPATGARRPLRTVNDTAAATTLRGEDAGATATLHCGGVDAAGRLSLKAGLAGPTTVAELRLGDRATAPVLHFSGPGRAVWPHARAAYRRQFPRCLVAASAANVSVVKHDRPAVAAIPMAAFCGRCLARSGGTDAGGRWAFAEDGKAWVAAVTAIAEDPGWVRLGGGETDLFVKAFAYHDPTFTDGTPAPSVSAAEWANADGVPRRLRNVTVAGEEALSCSTLDFVPSENPRKPRRLAAEMAAYTCVDNPRAC